MKLHLGCGKRDFGEGWHSIDCEPFPHVESYSITHLPFEDNSCDLLYASHVINYFDRNEVILLLQEWRRVLKPNGILRLAVPNFDAIVNLYIEGHDLQKFLGPLYGRMNDDLIYHKTAYNYTHLAELLLTCGFSSVSRYDWRTTCHAEFDDHSQAYIPHMDKDKGTLISLNLEARK